MKFLHFGRYAGPFVALGGLVAVVCLVGSWYINRLQTSLARTVKHDSEGMVAAVDLQGINIDKSPSRSDSIEP